MRRIKLHAFDLTRIPVENHPLVIRANTLQTYRRYQIVANPLYNVILMFMVRAYDEVWKEN